MSRRPCIVLKFGGSVLRDEETLRGAVHEIHRWRRKRFGVIAVVSALAGTTDELLGRCRALSDDSDPHAVAAVVAGGEMHSASLLGVLLDRAGIPARVLSPGAVGLIAEGPPLDAEPRRLCNEPFRAALDADEVVVFPGFVACDRAGRTVALGRGGSDLTALFLASRLDAERCRLIKDVDGLYASDPSAEGPKPPRFATVAWDDALETDGTVLQHKAVRFARQNALAFELGELNGLQPTLVGAGPTRAEPAAETPSGRLRVALLGLGTVGGGVYELLRLQPERFEIASILVRGSSRRRPSGLDSELVTNDVGQAIADVDVVVEMLGGMHPAEDCIRRALARGAHVVTANKAVVARHGDELAALARRQGRSFVYSAAVAGCAPVLERLGASDERVESVRGVLNGTVNFVLDGLARGSRFDDLIAEARARGFTEGDGGRDLSGQDALDKLVVTAGHLGRRLDPGSVQRDRWDDSVEGLVRDASASSLVVRQVSTLFVGTGDVRGRVALEALEADDPLAKAFGELNVAELRFDDGSTHVVTGKGAGRWPTAESVVGDLLRIARRERRAPRTRRSADLARVG